MNRTCAQDMNMTGKQDMIITAQHSMDMTNHISGTYDSVFI